MLAKEEIDIAAPVLPVSANPEVVIACAEAGVRAIFSEKPIAASLQEADRMVEVCRSRGIPFASGDSWRNLPQFRQFRSMVDRGEVETRWVAESAERWNTDGVWGVGGACRRSL